MGAWAFPAGVFALAVSPAFLAIAKVRRSVALGYSAVLLAAAVVLLVFHSFGWRVVENRTSSLPGSFYVYRVGTEAQKGDAVAFLWNGAGQYPKGATFLKRVVGVAGDEVRVVGRDVYVGDLLVGSAKTASKSGMVLEVAGPGAIPEGYVFVATPHPDSFDSRYALVGNVEEARILGKAYEVF